MKQLIIGLGSGRCGTYSFQKLLSENGVAASHENFLLPWDKSTTEGFRAICMLLRRSKDFVADVGFYWINYVPDIVKYVPEPRFVCLKRDRQEVVESFDKRHSFDNFWTSPTSIHWDWNTWSMREKVVMMPKYNLPKREALGAYWDEYYRLADAYARMWPDKFKVVDYKRVLNDEGVQREVLSFCGIDDPKLSLGKVFNANDSIVMEQNELPKTGAKQECSRCREKNAEWVLVNKTHNFLSYVCGECREQTKLELRKAFGG